MLNNEILAPSLISSSIYHLVNVKDPKPVLLCILRGDSTDTCVGGLRLDGGCKWSFFYKYIAIQTKLNLYRSFIMPKSIIRI